MGEGNGPKRNWGQASKHLRARLFHRSARARSFHEKRGPVHYQKRHLVFFFLFFHVKRLSTPSQRSVFEAKGCSTLVLLSMRGDILKKKKLFRAKDVMLNPTKYGASDNVRATPTYFSVGVDKCWRFSLVHGVRPSIIACIRQRCHTPSKSR
jgi:hypothetical protein